MARLFTDAFAAEGLPKLNQFGRGIGRRESGGVGKGALAATFLSSRVPSPSGEASVGSSLSPPYQVLRRT